MTQIYGKLFSKGDLSVSHLKVVELVGSSIKVLELGSSTGYLTKLFKENGCTVDIFEKDPDDVKKALKYANKAYVGSLDDESFLKKISGKYDVVVAADVLEHLKNPDYCLKYLKNLLNRNGRLIVSLPNISCWKVRSGLFFKGKFSYQDSGIMDKTHLRFYTYFSVQDLLKNAGFRILNVYPMESSYPFRPKILKMGKRRHFVKLAKFIDRTLSDILIKLDPNLFTYHMILEAR